MQVVFILLLFTFPLTGVVLIAWDVWKYRHGQITISEQVRDGSRRWPILVFMLGASIGFVVGFLAAHFFFWF